MSREIVHNRYQIHEKIGKGAVGQVFKAYDQKAQRFVALKTIPANAGDDTIQRFLREAEVTAKVLKHPNVVEVYEFGQDEGKLFIAMELLDGTDLRRFIKSRPPVSIADKLDIMLRICQGVGFAHSKNVVHRDLAPSNIHILPDGQIKIMDFGLVRLAESDMTRTGVIMGTPSYMSPEQAEGKKVDPAADVFSLGAVFYELLTGKKAFRADSILSTLFLILNEDHEPIANLVSDVPLALVEVIDRALSKNAEARFADANALHQALAALAALAGFAERPEPDHRAAPRSSWRALVSALIGSGTTTDGGNELTQTGASEADRPGEQPIGLTSLAGNLNRTSLAVLLRYCADNTKVGALHLRRGPIEKRLFFVGGRLLSTTTNSPRETLGQHLIRTGCISEDQLHQSLAEQERSGLPLGRIAVAHGWLTDSRLKELLREKSEETIYDCFLWPEGDFAFEDGRTPDNVYMSEHLDVTHLIHEGEHRKRRWQRIRERFPSTLTTFGRTDATPSESGSGSRNDPLELAPEDHRILEWVERGRNLAEIALEVHGVEFYVASRLLDLLEQGFIEIAEAPEARPYEDQVRELRDLLRRGLTHFNAGEDDEALQAFDAALAIDPLSKAYLYVRKIHERQRVSEEEETPFTSNDVPRVAVDARRLQDIKLTPEEFFVLSRVHGDWSIGAILQICPMNEEDTKEIFRKLLKTGVLALSSEASARPNA